MRVITIRPEESSLESLNVLDVTDDSLEVLEPNGDRTLIAELLTESNDEKTGGRISVDDLRQ